MANILIVEDDQSILNSYGFGLKARGFNVSLSDSGSEALAMINAQQFDLIVLDLLMPSMSGLDFLKAAQPKDNLPNTKILVLSNTEAPKIISEALSLGATEYLLKVDNTPSELADKVAQMLGTNTGGK